MHDVAKTTPAEGKMKSNRKTLWIAIAGLAGLTVLLVLIKGLQIFTMISAKPPMQVETVTSAIVEEKDWAPVLSAVGSISPVQGAMISSELAGTVDQVAFESGALVKKGDLLVKLNTAIEDAQLRSADADLELARADVERSRDLAARKVVAKAELDAAESKFQQKNAMIDNMHAAVAKKTMRAPFDGVAGIRTVNVGQTVNAGQQIVPLQSLDPVFADFALPQQHLGALSAGLEVQVTTDAMSGRVFAGKLTAVNSMVDVATRNVALQATLENPDHALRPGMFVKIDVLLPQKHRTLVIPGSAVSYAPYGDSVFVIEKQKDPKTGRETQVLRQQIVRIGEARGDFASVTTGLKAGETVVGTGVFKLRNGMAVTINNDLAPKPQILPTPTDS
jgi:membrane fusion protein (multidrug efflux system)